MNRIIDNAAVERIINTDHHDPFQILGIHETEFNGKKCVAVRAFLPDAQTADVVDTSNGEAFKMNKLHDAGFFEAVITARNKVFSYRLKSYYANGASAEFYDSYAFMPTIGEMDQHLFSEGNHHELHEKMGAHVKYFDYFEDKFSGVSFGVCNAEGRSGRL